jgi:hypothetical protein
MGWAFFQELLHAKPEDMPKLWLRARSKFMNFGELTAAPAPYDPRLIKDAIIAGVRPDSKLVDQDEDTINVIIEQENKGGLEQC